MSSWCVQEGRALSDIELCTGHVWLRSPSPVLGAAV